MPSKYTVVSRGCFGDGSFGHKHVRERLAALIEELAAQTDDSEAKRRYGMLSEELIAPMTDDASEEDDALELLNTFACDGVHFDMVDGDLMLLSGDE